MTRRCVHKTAHAHAFSHTYKIIDTMTPPLKARNKLSTARNPRAAILGGDENEISFHCLSAATFLAQYKQLVNWQSISFLVLVEGWMAPWIFFFFKKKAILSF